MSLRDKAPKDPIRAAGGAVPYWISTLVSDEKDAAYEMLLDNSWPHVDLYEAFCEEGLTGITFSGFKSYRHAFRLSNDAREAEKKVFE